MILAVVFAIIMVVMIPLLILGILTYLNSQKNVELLQGQAQEQEEEEISNNKQTQNTDNQSHFLISVLNQLSNKSNEWRFTDDTNLVARVETPLHVIHMLPCYHNLQDPVQHFLHKNKPDNALYMVIDGEPNPIPRSDKLDVVITTKRDSGDSRDVYIPYYTLYANQFSKPISNLFEPSLPHRTSSLDAWLARSFIVFAYTNDNTTRYDGCAKRSLFYQLLLKRVGSRVHNLGQQCSKNKMFATDQLLKSEYNYKDNNYQYNDDRYSKYKFVVAFENSQMQGYITEKIINPLLAGSIPVYFGASDVDEHINPECFINVDNYDSFESCIEDLLQLENDVPRLTKMLKARPLDPNSNFLDFLRNKGGKLWPRLRESKMGYLIPVKRLLPNRIVFVTFSYDDLDRAKKVQEEANRTGCFDDIITLRSENIPYDFLEKHRCFIGRHPENHGLGIWKSMFLYRQLQTMCDQDLLVFCEMDKVIEQNKDQEWLDTFQHMLQGGAHAVAWKDNFPEKNCTKKQCLDQLCVEENTRSVVAQSDHVSASKILLKKTPEAMMFVEKWMQSAVQYSLLDDTRSPDEDPAFVNHLHDESVFSCLFKQDPYCFAV